MKSIRKILLPLLFAIVSVNVVASEMEDVQQEIQDYCMSTVPHDNDTEDQALLKECIKEQNEVLNRESESETSDCAPEDRECSQAENQGENNGQGRSNSDETQSTY